MANEKKTYSPFIYSQFNNDEYVEKWEITVFFSFFFFNMRLYVNLLSLFYSILSLVLGFGTLE